MNTAAELVDSLRALCKREGGHEVVASEIRASAAYLWQILHGTKHSASGTVRGVGRQLQTKLDRRYPGWAELSIAQLSAGQYGRPVAPATLQQPVSNTPTIQWESLTLTTALPDVFAVQMQDDSMAPWLLPGDVLTFNRRRAPVSGQPVLLFNRRGEPFVRLYRQRTSDNWTATPVNAAYVELDSERDGLQLVAAFEGLRRPG